ncbi:unnamed protein product, partial [Trypanosoma congolense IL3000]
MWGYFLLLLLLYVKVEFSSCHRDAEHKILCDVFMSAEWILNNFIKNKQLNEAVYGESSMVRFDGQGNINSLGYRCVDKLSGRAMVCTSRSGGHGADGCFSGSLVGTILCVCTPGKTGRSENCKTNELGGEAWHGGFRLVNQHLDRKKDLFRKVWQAFIESCTDGIQHKRGRADQLDALNNSVKVITEKLKKDGTYFYLGGGA